MKNTFFLLALFLSATVAAQNFTLKGKVVDDANAPLPGAAVQVQYPWGEDAGATATDAVGHFEINNIEKGGYVLKVTFLGFEELRK
ncbi:MAG: carboxypeptidase regulatory-like domain-containing protein, partial [Bacteroidetes bacterium]|nr:carboxypeptidase regulatory-like domain-containing protein [Bacteroidota bacterium]